MGRRNNSLILFSSIFVVCSLAFQNCSSLQTFILLTSPVQAQSKKDNPLNDMMNYSEQQIKDTREKLEKRSDLFGEQKLEALKVGPKQRMNTETGVTTEVFDLEGPSEEIKIPKRKIATDSQQPSIDYEENLNIDNFDSKLDEEKKEGRP